MSETNQLMHQIIHYLTTCGVLAWRNNTGAAVYEDAKRSGRARFIRYGERGSGDILAVMPDGIFLSIEVKIGKDRLRDSQIEWIRKVEQVNGETLIARSLDDVVAFWERRTRDQHDQSISKPQPMPVRQIMVRRMQGRGPDQTSTWDMDDNAMRGSVKPVTVMTYDARVGKWVCKSASNQSTQDRS